MNILPIFSSNKWEGFDVADLSQARGKIARIRKDGSRKLYIVVDWDNTIIRDSVWRIIRDKAVPKDINKVHTALFSKYYPDLENGSYSEQKAKEWHSLLLDSLQGLAIDSFKKPMENVSIREGGRQLFKICEENNVPIIIRSAAIREFIDMIASANDIHPSLVIATGLHIKDGYIIGWDKDTMTHDLNKHIVSHENLTSLLEGRTNVLLIGDRVHDTKMVSDTSENIIFRVRVGSSFDAKNPNAWKEYLNQSFQPGFAESYPFDAVVQYENLFAVVSLVEWLVEYQKSAL